MTGNREKEPVRNIFEGLATRLKDGLEKGQMRLMRRFPSLLFTNYARKFVRGLDRIKREQFYEQLAEDAWNRTSPPH